MPEHTIHRNDHKFWIKCGGTKIDEIEITDPLYGHEQIEKWAYDVMLEHNKTCGE